MPKIYERRIETPSLQQVTTQGIDTEKLVTEIVERVVEKLEKIFSNQLTSSNTSKSILKTEEDTFDIQMDESIHVVYSDISQIEKSEIIQESFKEEVKDDRKLKESRSKLNQLFKSKRDNNSE